MSGFSMQLKKTAAVAVGILIIAGAGGAWWYKGVYTATPEYTIHMLEDAVEHNDKDLVYKYVDVEHLLDTTSDALLDGLVASTLPVNVDNKEALAGFTQMFKNPIMQSLHNAMDNYILYGNWSESSKKDGAPSPVDGDLIVERTGLAKISYRSAEPVEVDKENGTAVVKVKIYQEEADAEYELNVQLVKKDDVWQVYEVTNAREYIDFLSEARKKLLIEYMEKSGDIISAHDKIIRDIERDMHMMMTTGSLGDDSFRAEMKKIVLEKYMAEWQSQKAELEQLNVPAVANTLQKLRIRICDMNISYAENYAKWLDNKNVASLREAESSSKQARTLEQEAEKLAKQVQLRGK